MKHVCTLTALCCWTLPLAHPSVALSDPAPSQIALQRVDYQFKHNVELLSSHPSWISPMSLSSLPLNAIVKLQGLNLPQAKANQGQATISLQLLEGSQVYTMELSVGGEPASFLLDTGASTTMVATALIQQLGLTGKPIPNEGIAYAVAGDDCPEMNAVLHRLPPVVVHQVRVEELNGLEFSSTIIPDDLSGVLGMDFLRNFDVKLNPKIRQLQLLPPSQISVEEFSQAIPLQSRLGVMLAQVKINGEGPFTFMLDTGADTIFISQSLAKRLQLDASDRQEIQVQGFCGLEAAEQSTLEQVQVHNHRLYSLEAVILSSPVLDLLEVDGILGQNFLNQYQQHWRFTSQGQSGEFQGSLLLIPLKKSF